MSSPTTLLIALVVAALALVAVAYPAGTSPLEDTPSSPDCPDGCFCYAELSRLVVKCRRMSSPPENLPPSTSVLVLDGVPLHQLTASSLHIEHLHRLEAIHCVGCSLQRVEVSALAGLQGLQIVDLADNDIVGLTADDFADFAALRVLDLSGNLHVDCVTLKSALPKVAVNCDSSFTGTRRRRQAAESAITLPAPVVTSPGEVEAEVEASTLPADREDREDECTSPAWKVIAIVFIVLWSISCLCNVLKCCCECCSTKQRTTKGPRRPQGGNTVYQMTTTELDDRYT